ncbi:hypothetical protein [Streptomyces sp. NPDC059076]|uniref:hypothetical protein n=1 Tax=unclassified Streptomyces TaxID=2593676 RepID=UPI0036811274
MTLRGSHGSPPLLELVADEKSPLPDIEATRRRLAHGLDLTSRLTVGDWLDM